ncbi:hypothetical protein GCM10025779_15460 [Arthrobacter cryoconiti]
MLLLEPHIGGSTLDESDDSMRANGLRNFAWKSLVVVVIFNAISAVGGSTAMLVANALFLHRDV